MAERVGFEPTSPVLPGYPLSRRALSTAQTPLRIRCTISLTNAKTSNNRSFPAIQHDAHAKCRGEEPSRSATEDVAVGSPSAAGRRYGVPRLLRPDPRGHHRFGLG